MPLAILLFGFVSSACDADHPVTASPAPAAPLASTSAGFSVIGSASVETSAAYYSTPEEWTAFDLPRNTGYVIPPHSLAIVRVTGVVTLSPNPAWYSAEGCEGTSWTQCSFPEAGSHGPLAPLTNAGSVSIFAGNPSTSGAPLATDPGWLHAVSAANAPFTWETLVSTDELPAEVWYRPRNILSFSTRSCPECTDVVKQYVESDGYQMSIELVRIGSSLQTAADGTVTYTVSAPLETHGVYWYYAPDTAAIPFHAMSAEMHVEPCLGQPTCTYAPDTIGRMYAFVSMESAVKGYGANYSATPSVMFDVTPGAPQILLRCEGLVGTQMTANRVTRGQTLDCTAYKDPANAPGDMVITGWRFDSTPRTDGNLTSPEWGGPMTRSGRVVVRGRIGTGPERDRAVAITVVARPWPEVRLTEPPDVLREVDPVSMKPYPAPGTPTDPSTFGRFKLNWPDFNVLPVLRVTLGPNNGDGILAAGLTLPRSTVYIHPALTPTPSGLSPGMPGYEPWHAWYDDQNGKPSGTCRPTQVATFKTNVERHEGVTMASNSHWGKANTAFSSGKVQGQMEGLFLTIQPGESDAEFENRLHVAATQTFDDFMANTYFPLQDQFDINDTPTVYNIGCNLDFNLADN